MLGLIGRQRLVNSAELNAAGVPYYTQTDSQTNLSHSTSTSTSSRARALTASANDNPRAPKRRVDYASCWRDDIYGTPPSVASEPAGMYSSAGVGDLGHKTTGRIQLPPIQSNSVPVDSHNMAIHQSLPPSQFSGNPPANLPPIRSMFENSAPGLPGFASTYDPAPQTPTVPLRRRPVPRGSWGGGWGSVPVDYNPPNNQPFAQATDRRQLLHDPARAAHTPVRPTNRPLKTPNASSNASRAHTPKQRPPQPITIVTTPTRASRDDDVIDLTHSSSPPDAATLFGPRRGPAPAPLIKQESFPLSLSGDHKRQDKPPPALPGPPSPPGPPPSPPGPPPPPPLPTSFYSTGNWNSHIGGQHKVVAEVTFRTRVLGYKPNNPKDRPRWMIPEDVKMINYIYKLPYTKEQSEIVQKALTPAKRGEYSIVIHDMNNTIFYNNRKPSAIHRRVRGQAENWQATNLLLDHLGVGFNFERGEAELIAAIGPRLAEI
ncbi:hypothetical protein FRC09_007118 [Ceratobasidium sp. 395]|nr:hypothetical protein FRC09_007118 [Ceratobasidium sp. 395]